jgi:alcohol dehydrogenase class IV
MKAFRCHLPRTEFGAGRLEELGDLAGQLGQRALLAIDPYLEQIWLGDRVDGILGDAGITAIRFSDIQPNPSCFGADEAASLARESEVEFVIAVGGGSTIDFGKGVAVLAANPGTCWQYTERSDHEVLRPARVLPIVAVPTTSGTGSEATHYAVFNNPAIREKSTIVSPKVFPVLALVDPALTYSMPSSLTASTGFDALAHAIEAVISVHTTPFARLTGIEAIGLIARHLPTAVNDGIHTEARAAMSWAAVLAGAAIASGGVALPHAIAQPVSGLTGAPHGASISACMTTILSFSYEAAPEQFAAVAEALQPTNGALPIHEQARLCPTLVESLMDQIGLRVRFSDFGMTEADIDKATHIALTGYSCDIECHPMPVSEEDIKRVYRECL